MPIRIKAGVKIDALQPQIVLAISVADSFLRGINRDCWLTSVNEGAHVRTSMHHLGMAVDFRRRHLTSIEAETFAGHLRSALGPQFDVILTDTHVHVEYQPKVSADRPL